jgi:hypothetical protein
MADFNAQQSITDVGSSPATTDASDAAQLVPDASVASTPALAVDIPADQLIGVSGTSVTKYFRMRGVDSGTSTYTTWTATDAPDPNGAQATVLNTTPVLVGAIVAASGTVLTAWQS